MCNTDDLKTKDDNNNEVRVPFGSKAAFVAGIVLIITIIKDIWEIVSEIPDVVVATYVCVCLIIFYIVLGTKKLDKYLNSKEISNFSDFLTVMSVIVFILENTFIRDGFTLTIGEAVSIIAVLLSIVVGALSFFINEDKLLTYIHNIKLKHKYKKSKKYKNKLCFWRFDNGLFLAISVVCIIAWYCIYFTEWLELDDIAVSLISGILSAALIPLGLNYGKYVKEKKQIKIICKSIIDLSAFIVNNFNTHLIKMNKPMLENIDALSGEKTKPLDFDKFKADYDLFDLVSKKLSQLIQKEYFNSTDYFIYAVEKTTSSIQKSMTNENHSQLCKDLCTAVKIVGTIKPLSQRKNYVAIFNEKIDKSNRVLKNNFYSYTEEYIIECIERDLSEKMSK